MGYRVLKIVMKTVISTLFVCDNYVIWGVVSMD